MQSDASVLNVRRPKLVTETAQLLPGFALITADALTFLARDNIYAIARYMLSVRPSVRHTGGSVKDG